MRTVTPDQLAAAIQEVLDEYREDAQLKTTECVKAVAKQGVKALKANSPRDTGEYAKGWKSQLEESRTGATAILHNDNYRLPHLLEFGHVSRNGTGRDYGSVAAIPHIKPVEETLIREYTNKLKQELSQ